MSAADVIFGSTRVTDDDLQRSVKELSPAYTLRWFCAANVVLLTWRSLRLLPSLITFDWLTGVILFGSAVFYLLLAHSPRVTARKLRKVQCLDEGEVQYRFDPEGITLVTPGASATFAYRRIYRFLETTDAFLLFTLPGTVANVVLKRSFAAADLIRVRAYLAANVTAPSWIQTPRAQRIAILTFTAIHVVVTWHLVRTYQP
jgi:hypothetical protein